MADAPAIKVQYSPLGDTFTFGARPKHLACEGCKRKPLCGVTNAQGTTFLCAYCERQAPVPERLMSRRVSHFTSPLKPGDRVRIVSDASDYISPERVGSVAEVTYASIRRVHLLLSNNRCAYLPHAIAAECLELIDG